MASVAAKITRAIPVAMILAFLIPQQSIAATAAPADIVRQVLSAPDNKLDYAQAKLAFDQVIDPSIEPAKVMAELDGMAAEVKAMAGPRPGTRDMLTALQQMIYQSGPWNDNRPFSYDLDDPLGTDIHHKLLSVYLTTRRGNCVSMPVLFLILADRVGLSGAALANAPLHSFIRYTDSAGHTLNLETTSGAYVMPDAEFRRKLPMTDRAIESGLYMRSLTRREAVANMASVVVEYLVKTGRNEDAIAVADVILKNDPRNGFVMAKQATAYAQIMEVEFAAKYPTPDLIPESLRARYRMLDEKNRAAWDAAEALGWRPDE